MKGIVTILIALLTLTSCGAIDKIGKSTQPQSDNKQAALKFMNSQERIDRYKKMWPAATKVAEALLADKLGAAKRVNSDYEALKPGYTGWGYIQSGTEDHENSAKVWWKADGSADLKKGVPSFAVDGFGSDSEDKGHGAYVTFIPTVPSEGIARVVSAERIDERQHPAGYVYPLTIEKLREFDASVPAALTKHMKVAKLA